MLVLALSIVATPSSATISVDEFLASLEECRPPGPGIVQTEGCHFANGYVLGTLEGILASEKKARGPDHDPTTCRNLADTVTPRQLVDEFRRELTKRRTEQDHDSKRPVSLYFFEFFETSYPCRSG